MDGTARRRRLSIHLFRGDKRAPSRFRQAQWRRCAASDQRQRAAGFSRIPSSSTDCADLHRFKAVFGAAPNTARRRVRSAEFLCSTRRNLCNLWCPMKSSSFLTLLFSIFTNVSVFAQQSPQSLADAELPSLLTIYKDFHMHPELSEHEERSAAIVAKEL